MRGAASAAVLITLPALFWGDDVRQEIAKLRGRHFVVSEDKFPAVLYSAPTDAPIVVGDPKHYAVLWYYSPDDLRRKLYLLTDLQGAVKKADPLPELSTVGNREFVPFRLSDYGDFTRDNREFYLYCRLDLRHECESERTWVKNRLLAEGFSLNIAEEREGEMLFRVARGASR
jgi:hypothetical protein